MGAATLASAVLVSCGSRFVPPTAPTADFSLTVAPPSATVTAGGSGQVITLDARSVNGFAGTVSVAVSGLPAGVTASPTTLTLNAGVAQNFTLTAASTAASGSATVTFTGTSGSLSHTATLSLTVQGQSTPPPASGDFSLTVAPTSASLTAGGNGQTIQVNATPSNGFSSTVSVAISGLPSGVTASPASLSLTPGTAQNVTLTAGSSAAAGSGTVTFTGTSGSLSHAATLSLTVQAQAPPPPPPPTTGRDVTTYHYDNARDGLNAQETILTLSNVNSAHFGKVGFDSVDGKVDAEPLYLSGITAGGQARNVLYVATERDSVYAFDADTGTQLWKTSILGSGETPSDDHGCSQITPEIGITSTPVIDRNAGPNGTIFVVGMTKDGSGNYHQRLHALDVTTGAEVSGSPTEITASYPGTGAASSGGNVAFNPAQYAERAALLLVNGTIYMGWTSHCDGQPYSGWVMGYSESTLKQTQVLNLTPNGSEGSIWMAGDGIAADSAGNLYFLDANGTFDTTLDSNGFPAQGDFGNAILKLSTSGKLAVADYFETYNTVSQSNADADMGSGGEILLPDQTDGSGGVHHLLVGAGKDTNIYVVDRDNMGKFSASGNSAVYQEVTGALPTAGVRSTPAFFNGVLYYGPAYTQMRAFPMTNAKLATSPSSMTAVSFPYPGATPSISANGTSNGIVWALESNLSSPGVLHAYDAANLTHELYNSNQAASGRDAFGNGNKFVTPVVVNGKVYVPTQNGVAVFGLLP
ncbi:MAG: hypothetical protein ACLGSD_02415 [Acidobacteriota bacterium]